MHQLLIIFIHQYMVDVKNNATRKNLNNLTKQMFVHNIQFVNNTFSNSLHIVFSSAVISSNT